MAGEPSLEVLRVARMVLERAAGNGGHTIWVAAEADAVKWLTEQKFGFWELRLKIRPRGAWFHISRSGYEALEREW